jgi:WD40 repeat protein
MMSSKLGHQWSLALGLGNGRSSDCNGERWPSQSVAGRLPGLIVLIIIAAVLAVGSSDASAAQTRPYTGTSFGPDGLGGVESFVNLQSLTVDQATGDLFAFDAGAGKVYKFDSTGAPVDFTLTGSNAIEGVGGGGNGENEIAVAPAGAPGGTDGDIYVANNSTVKVYGASGAELGSFGEGETCGVAVNSAGAVFVGSFGETIREYLPSSNPPSNTDLSATGQVNVGLCNVAVDGVGNVYAARFSGVEIARLDGLGDTSPSIIRPGGATLAVDPGTNQLYVDRGNEVAVYDSAGSLESTFGEGEVSSSDGIAVATNVNEVLVGDASSGKVKVFGPPVTVPTVVPGITDVTSPSEATLKGSVNPEGIAVTECFFEYATAEEFENTGTYGATVPCQALPPTTSEPGPVSAAVTGLEPNGVTYHFRLVARNANGLAHSVDQTFVSASTVVTEGPNPIGLTAATLRGTVFPEGIPFTGCEFEYGPVTSAGFPEKAACNPPAASIPANSSPQAVEAPVTGLEPNAIYRVRLLATNALGTVRGGTLTFATSGKPVVTEVRARDADQSSVTLEAVVDPRRLDTAYRIEWGPTNSYGTLAASGSIKAAEGATRVSTTISGLAPETIYHYRIVAANAAGTRASPDQELETLNSCGLPEGRCFELVSPRDVGPVAQPGKTEEQEVGFQAATEPGLLAYSIFAGLPAATKGDIVLYTGRRSSTGWTATQFSPPITDLNETNDSPSLSSRTLGMSSDLSCAIVASPQPLTTNPSGRRVVELGGVNLYRRNPDGTYTLITNLPPENPEGVTASFGGEYQLAGFSENCGRVVFQSTFQYPGVGGIDMPPFVPGAEGRPRRLYEWDEGELRAVGIFPGGAGEAALGAFPATFVNHTNFVSTDGQRVAFSAVRQSAANSEENEKVGVFVRQGGAKVAISESQTTTPDLGAAFQSWSSDGSRLFFLANYGLTSAPSNGPVTDNCAGGQVGSGTHCDLYEYDFAKASGGRLTDLSADSQPEDPEGAEVAGFIGSSPDGSVAYFVARGQLIAGEGRSYAENVATNGYSVYRSSNGTIQFVASIGAADLREVNGLIVENGEYEASARVSQDGRYLLFQSSANVTGYASGGAQEAYLFDAAAPAATATVCVSCRQDGRPSLTPSSNGPLAFASIATNPFGQPMRLVIRHGVPLVFFGSFDRLAPGAAEGEPNVYEWAHGQVFRIATEPPGVAAPGEEGTKFAGASAEGSDLYLASPATLSWERRDGRLSVWDAPIGGGFAEPPAPPPLCSPTSEGSGSCSGSGAPVSTVPDAASQTFSGPGNPKKKRPAGKCKKGKGKKGNGKCKKGKGKKGNGKCKKGNGKCKRGKKKANRNGRAGK